MTPRKARLIALSLIPIIAQQALAQPVYTPKQLAPQKALEDIRILRSAVLDLHPGLDRYTSEQAHIAMLDQLEERAQTGITDTELFLESSRILARLRCDHTKTELPPAIEEARTKEPSYLPFTFKLVDGRMYADQVTTQLTRKINRRDEILAINDQPVGRILERITPLVSVDGYTDHAAISALQYSNEYMGDAVDHFLPFLEGFTTSFTITARSHDSGEVNTFRAKALTYPGWQTLATGSDTRYGSNFDSSVTYRRINDSTAYLAIDTFVNYRTNADPRAILQPHFDDMRSNDIDHLILDLRNCGGGSNEVPATLIRYLSPTPAQIYRSATVRQYRFEDLRPYIETWDQSIFSVPDALFTPTDDGNWEVNLDMMAGASRIQQPYDDRFEGDLTILIGPQNSSGATAFCARINELRDVTFIGQPQGGSAEGPTAGILLFVVLPNSKIKLRIPLMMQYVDINSFDFGMGLTPDIEVNPTVDDIFENRDVALEAAINNARNN